MESIDWRASWGRTAEKSTDFIILLKGDRYVELKIEGFSDGPVDGLKPNPLAMVLNPGF